MPAPFRLDGKTALITGGASGIGDAICRVFSQAGASLVIADIDKRQSEALAAELGKAEAVHCDITDENSVRDMLGSVEDAGAPDIERGDELAADLLAALQPVKTTFEEAVVEAQTLPTDDPETFSAAATELGNSITGSQGDFQTQFNALQQEYDSPEINAAFETVPACAEVG